MLRPFALEKEYSEEMQLIRRVCLFLALEGAPFWAYAVY